MRLFAAIDVPSEVSERICSIFGRLESGGAKLRFTARENIHITLKFLGEVDEERIPDVVKGMRKVANQHEKFTVSVEGVGYFGNSSYPRVIWVGISEGRDKVVEIMKSLERELGWARREGKPPSPHITIARVKQSGDVHRLLREVEGMERVKFGEFHVNNILLKSSVLGMEGPVYRNIERFPLREPELRL